MTPSFKGRETGCVPTFKTWRRPGIHARTRDATLIFRNFCSQTTFHGSLWGPRSAKNNITRRRVGKITGNAELHSAQMPGSTRRSQFPDLKPPDIRTKTLRSTTITHNLWSCFYLLNMHYHLISNSFYSTHLLRMIWAEGNIDKQKSIYPFISITWILTPKKSSAFFHSEYFQHVTRLIMLY